MAIKNLPTTYDPNEFENRIYKFWEENKYFEAKVDETKESYCIMLPPPNITGQLHMGHALDHTLQDILIRWKRMEGKSVLWQPGTDHASIATEVKVVERIKKDEGKTKYELGREEFLNRAWSWRDEFGRKIVNQMKKLGDSCDWQKERFTMDEGCNKAVTEFFVKLYEEGHIYRGNRIINWCPDCKTSLSDAEVEYEESNGHFWHFRYPVKDSNEDIIIATTRPETILGDTAVAVNPNDERYKHLIGKTLILPLVNREIIIVADDYVDVEFGTGAVKITPAHDPNDFEVGQRHNLEQINVMNEDGSMNKLAGKYEGMDRYECRKELVKDMKEAGFLVEIKEHNHNVGQCYRCNTVVEPRLSEQWFVKMNELAKPAIEVVKNQKVKLVPDRFNKTYYHWLENIKDWCISRQLWWGHRIPAYYCQDCNEIMVSKELVTECKCCKSKNIKQDEDVLDTWFSSALWPFSTLGWPNENKELDYFFPTSTLVTGYDIIFFWVVRMVFASLFCKKEIPFENVLIHGLVRDSEGRKMSKSLGNGIDPLEIIDNFGADALRFTLATGNTPGNDMRFYMERVESSRNFANKLWNASRFVLMNLEEELLEDFTFENVKNSLKKEDKWIISSQNKFFKEVTDNMEKFELGMAAQKIYDFTWNTYCDWYIEMVKPRLYSEDKESKKAALYTLTLSLENILKLLHPYMPFITEEIYSYLPKKEGAIINAKWPEFAKEFEFENEENDVEFLMHAVKNIRNIRAEMDVKPSRKAAILFIPSDDKINLLKNSEAFFKTLAFASKIEIKEKKSEIPEDAVASVMQDLQIYLPLEDLIDFEKEIERLQKEKEKFISEIKRVEGKLSNQGFIAKAPESLVEQEKAKKDKYNQLLLEVEDRISSIKSKMK